VNGVGARLALTILSGSTPTEFVRLILNNDTASLVRLPGVGKKTAERLVIEMRDKLGNWEEVNTHTRHPVLQDAISSLLALGYKLQ
jgi:Holliday junction DNA helicase RuvA